MCEGFLLCRIDCFTEFTGTSAFGEKLKEQVEERLRFYDEGIAPTKNAAAMQVCASLISTTAHNRHTLYCCHLSMHHMIVKLLTLGKLSDMQIIGAVACEGPCRSCEKAIRNIKGAACYFLLAPAEACYDVLKTEEKIVSCSFRKQWMR